MASTKQPDHSVQPAPAAAEELTVTLELEEGYRQTIDFGLPGVAPLTVDEPAPLGSGTGPNPSRLLAGAVGSCLAASLAFCMRKARLDVRGVRTTVRVSLTRSERGRLRVGGLTCGWSQWCRRTSTTGFRAAWSCSRSSAS